MLFNNDIIPNKTNTCPYDKSYCEFKQHRVQQGQNKNAFTQAGTLENCPLLDLQRCACVRYEAFLKAQKQRG